MIVFICVRSAAAKSLQSCPTLCDPIDSSPPGSPVPGILQARTLEWVASSFSNCVRSNFSIFQIPCFNALYLFHVCVSTPYNCEYAYYITISSLGMYFDYIKLLRLRLLCCSSVGMPDKRNFTFIYFSWLPTSFKFHRSEKAHWLSLSLSLSLSLF